MWIYIWIMFLGGNKCSYLTKFSIVYTHHSWISKLKIILRSHRKYFKYNYLCYSYTQSYNLIYILITDCTHILIFFLYVFFSHFFFYPASLVHTSRMKNFPPQWVYKLRWKKREKKEEKKKRQKNLKICVENRDDANGYLVA